MSFFGTSSTKPALSLGLSTAAPANPSTSLFGQTTTQPAANPTTTATTGTSSQPQIDLAHLRSTTKFDQLTPDLQKEIESVDTLILNQIKLASEVSDLLPTVIAAGETLPNGVDFVSQKLEEAEAGLGNDAEAIVEARDGDMRKVELEAKCVFRAIDRLKMPRQYQVSHTQNESLNGGGMYGGAGLSGWWNNPQTLRGSVRGGHAQGHTIQLPGEDAEEIQGPKSLLELFNTRAEEMQDMIQGNRQLLGEIEGFVQGLEEKVIGKERELNDRFNYGDRNGSAISERDRQIQLLRYVFGEVQRSLYNVADKVGAARDDVAQLALGR
ncbi:uncharacterized protein Z518_10758 [Rhinocladiella mackenziei CBS 650.93]|uniref:Nucleoporin NUP49/NSP49 n=1 Tax=Rhinocladiella mackenziei CBS 650.93 TaxID=1442369 RepID=A0A0D2I993_9EURO|nr:uncharacterized protein Z518_10758 [Rhinocladiella mackenziei CBS 650.93]KIW99830.1 hypothetical protein Z518_10758 [Rhinocladiella mackenziei CBS 650.93]